MPHSNKSRGGFGCPFHRAGTSTWPLVGNSISLGFWWGSGSAVTCGKDKKRTRLVLLPKSLPHTLTLLLPPLKQPLCLLLFLVFAHSCARNENASRHHGQPSSKKLSADSNFFLRPKVRLRTLAPEDHQAPRLARYRPPSLLLVKNSCRRENCSRHQQMLWIHQESGTTLSGILPWPNKTG